jgi:hypothetical protein
VFVNTYEGIAEGQLSPTDATLRTLMGRPSTTLEETLSEVLHEASIPHKV